MNAREIGRYIERIDPFEKACEEGFAKGVLAAYEARFGPPPAALSAAVERASDHAELELWLKIVVTRSADEVAQVLRQARGSAAKALAVLDRVPDRALGPGDTPRARTPKRASVARPRRPRPKP